MSGPNNSPIPLAASIQPMYISLSWPSKELNIAILEVRFAPPPIPPRPYARKLKNRNQSPSLM